MDTNAKKIIGIALFLFVFPGILIFMGLTMYGLDVKAAAGAMIGGAIGAFFAIGINLIASLK